MHCGYTVITPTQQPHVVNILYAQRNDAEDEVSLAFLHASCSLAPSTDAVARWASGCGCGCSGDISLGTDGGKRGGGVRGSWCFELQPASDRNQCVYIDQIP